ncbi:hypothetical protein NDU88_008569 [Pleurodeles waltl]|uniref:Uncharacterized protein n=1 Tax=Pleurodeles waltl TaxID=8319 RepID=A0AAV7PWJ7_PLEWA|nr:hypothetical protein NDU88_008569 [Pleurodeles waltl]
MAEKRSRTEEVLEALMLMMDAMDQAIASLKAQTSSSGVVASSNRDVPQKIWKGAYINIFDLLVDKAENEEVWRCKECTHSRECGHGPQRRRVEESLSNWVRAFSIYQAILAERFSDLGAQLACYQNRIVGAHDKYGGTAWKEYDKEFRRIKAYKPWDQIHIITWLRYTNRTQGLGQHPFRGPAGTGSGASGGTGAKKGACWDFNRCACSRSPGTCVLSTAVPFVARPPAQNSSVLKNCEIKGPRNRIDDLWCVGRTVTFVKALSPVNLLAMVPWLNAFQAAVQVLYLGFKDGFRIPAQDYVDSPHCKNQLSLRSNPGVARCRYNIVDIELTKQLSCIDLRKGKDK